VMAETPKLRFLTISQVAEELNLNAPTVGANLAGAELRRMQVGGRGCGVSASKT
jgi:hypothetical protein